MRENAERGGPILSTLAGGVLTKGQEILYDSTLWPMLSSLKRWVGA